MLHARIIPYAFGYDTISQVIYDCFTFFNELDLLEIRLNVLKDVVDKFVLVEADRTFTNRPKRLFFEENKSRFAEFSDRIIHVKVTDHPPFKTAWHYESHQRNAIARGLIGAMPDDVVLVSDVDEIPNPEVVSRYAGTRGMVTFQQAYYAYYLNFMNVRRRRWCFAKMVSYADFLHGFDGVEVMHNEHLPEEVNEGTTASKVRMRVLPRSRGGETVVKNGGWHFTSLGGASALAEKMRSFSHQEYNPGEANISEAKLKELIERGAGPFWKMNCFALPIDDSFPKYIRENQERYAHLIFKITPEYLKRVRWARFGRTLQGRWIQLAEMACPSALHNWLHLIKMRILRAG